MEVNASMERRALPRLPGDTLDAFRLAENDGEVAHVQDISIVGVGLLVDKPFAAGSWLLLKPADNRMRLSPELKAEVRHSRAHGERGHFIGCRFSRMLTADDMMALGRK